MKQTYDVHLNDLIDPPVVVYVQACSDLAVSFAMGDYVYEVRQGHIEHTQQNADAFISQRVHDLETTVMMNVNAATSKVA